MKIYKVEELKTLDEVLKMLSNLPLCQAYQLGKKKKQQLVSFLNKQQKEIEILKKGQRNDS